MARRRNWEWEILTNAGGVKDVTCSAGGFILVINNVSYDSSKAMEAQLAYQILIMEQEEHIYI